MVGVALGRRRIARAGASFGMASAIVSCGTSEARSIDSRTVFYVQDMVGSEAMQFDAKGEMLNRQAYTPFGTALPSALLGKGESAAKVEPYGFVGKEFDEESGLSAMGSRYYSPKLARFVSADSYVLNKPGIGEQDGQSLNVYSYSRNTPTTLKDPEGTAPQDAAPGTAASGVRSYWAVAASIAASIAAGMLFTAAVGSASLPIAASIAVSAASNGVSGVVGGVVERAINSNGDLSITFSPKAMGLDAATSVGSAAAFTAVGAIVKYAGSKLGNAATKGLQGVDIPSKLAHVIPGEGPFSSLAQPSRNDVFVTAAEDVAGLGPEAIANRLAIPKSSSYTVIEFKTPSQGLASPVLRSDPGFVGRGLTAGGAREYVIPNGPIPDGAAIRVVR